MDLTNTLRMFYNDAAVALKWLPVGDFSIPLPTAEVFLDDDGFEGPVDRKGHGLQRAFIFSLLQHLAKATSAEAAQPNEVPPESAIIEPTENPLDEIVEERVDALAETGAETSAKASEYALPGLILVIEEPELYQHPTKQRHFAKVLSQISSGELPGVARQTQVIFATHSSLFVSMDRFDEICLARRIKVEGETHKECQLTQSDLEAVVKLLEHAYGEPAGTYSADGLKPRLHIISSEIAEGFFADLTVLVEGVSDRAALLAAAALEVIDFGALGVAILPVDGKTKLDRPTAIFLALGVPLFVTWDCDRGPDGVKEVRQNIALEKLIGVPDAEIFEANTTVSHNFACFETKLEAVLRQEIGAAIYDAQIELVKEKYDIDGRDVEKAPFAMTDLLARCAEAGGRSNTLRSIVRAIADLRDSNMRKKEVEGL